MTDTSPKNRASAAQMEQALAQYSLVRENTTRLLEAIRDLHELGFSLRQIGMVLDISHEQVRQRLGKTMDNANMRA